MNVCAKFPKSGNERYGLLVEEDDEGRSYRSTG